MAPVNLPVLVAALLTGAPATEPPPESVGAHANGCLFGGVPLPATGEGFVLVRPWRERNHAHPMLAAWLEGYARRLSAAGLGPARVGDASQAGGGPMPTGHRSHQTGLDVDLWFTAPTRGRGPRDLRFASMVDLRRERIDARRFGPTQIGALRLAAESPEVARIFVHWVVKRALCEAAGPDPADRAWLGKVRAWWGHDRHFHVRLACPPDSPECVGQAIPAGDGCEEAKWFSRAEVAARRAAGEVPPPRVPPVPPPRCRREPDGAATAYPGSGRP